MADSDDVIKKVERREARSGKVSYADPVILNETSRSRVEFVPFFIKHSDYTELSIKIITYRKSGSLPWNIFEDKSVSFKEASARKLLKALRQHLAVASEDSDGDYIVIPVSGGTADIKGHDPLNVAKALSKVLGQKGIVEHLSGLDLGSELVLALKSSIRFGEIRSAVSALRELLESGASSESEYQSWCYNHSWAFGNAYVMRDEVRDISAGDSLDILLPTVISGYRDIVELKRPDEPVLIWDKDHKNYYFSSEVSRAIGQCHRYIDILYDAAKDGLLDHPEVVAYYPRAIIVIGRSSGWSEDQIRALHGLNYRLYGVVVMTYDQLLAQGERLIQILGEDKSEDGTVSPSDEDFQVFDSDDSF